MYIFYTHDYRNEKGESHRLLTEAIAAYLDIGQDRDDTLFIELGDTDSSAEYVYMAEGLTEVLMTGAQGKPFIPGFSPFSISHSDHTWAVLIADSGCGLDIQYPRRADRSGIARRFYAREDAEHIEWDPEDFFRIWARREALIKAAGTSVAETDLPSVLADRVTYRGADYAITDISIPDAPELCAAVCLEDNERGLRNE